MSFYLEEECPVSFHFDYAKLAEDVVAFCIEHENFPYEAEVNLTLTDNDGIEKSTGRRMYFRFRCFLMRKQEILVSLIQRATMISILTQVKQYSETLSFLWTR